jgi:hypothetical protein
VEPALQRSHHIATLDMHSVRAGATVTCTVQALHITSKLRLAVT